MLDIEKIRASYPLPAGTAYLNTSSCGLVSQLSIEKAHQFHTELYSKGSDWVDSYLREELPQIRKDVCEFIDASVEELAFIPNFSYGLCSVIPAISTLKRVLLFREDYPSLIQPFLINDFEIHWVDSTDGFTIDINELKASILNNKIEILAISHVQYLTGFKIDIDELGAFCKLHDVLFIVDGTQCLGAIPFSFNRSNANIYITSNYKWMNGGYGTGIMCIKEETIARYLPTFGGFGSHKFIEGKWKYVHSINSYEPGHLNFPALSMLQEAIKFKNELGIDHIASHNMALLEKFVADIDSATIVLSGPLNNKDRCNIIGINGDIHLEKHLTNDGIIVKMRNDIIRVGIHFYNTESDIDRLVKSLNSL